MLLRASVYKKEELKESMATNPFQTLGVNPAAKQEEIKSTYRKLAKKIHPDLNPEK